MIVDVASAEEGIFSLENEFGMQFLSQPRRFADLRFSALASLQKAPRFIDDFAGH